MSLGTQLQLHGKLRKNKEMKLQQTKLLQHCTEKISCIKTIKWYRIREHIFTNT